MYVQPNLKLEKTKVEFEKHECTKWAKIFYRVVDSKTKRTVSFKDVIIPIYRDRVGEYWIARMFFWNLWKKLLSVSKGFCDLIRGYTYWSEVFDCSERFNVKMGYPYIKDKDENLPFEFYVAVEYPDENKIDKIDKLVNSAFKSFIKSIEEELHDTFNSDHNSNSSC